MLGIQPDGLEVFAPNGRAFRFPAWSFERVLMPWIVRWGFTGDQIRAISALIRSSSCG